jgi:arylsulfatase A-like enzyme
MSRIGKLLKLTGRVLWGPLHGPSADPNRRCEHAEFVSLAFAVCLALFLAKGFIAYRDLDRTDMPPAVCTGGFWVSAAQVWACSAQDFAVGLSCLLVGGVALRLVRSHGGRRGLRVAAHVVAAVALAYMIVNVQIFHVLRRFLTLSLFELGGGFKPERSVYAYATPLLKTVLAVAPAAALALHLLLAHKAWRFWDGVSGLVCRPLLLLAGIAGLCYVTAETQRTLFNDHRHDFTENPHLLLARSLSWDMDFGDVGPEPPETADFLPGRPRHVAPALATRPKNVIVIVLESASSVYLENYGAPFPTTPCLRELGPRSLTFENFYATANHTIGSALPICASVWNDPRAIATLIEYPQFPVPAASSWLRQQGYRTAILSSGGQQVWEGYRNLNQAFATTGWDVNRDSRHPFWAESRDPQRFQSEGYLDKDLFADARRFIRRAAQDKFFLLMWCYDMHAPYFGWGPGPDWNESKFPPAIRGDHREDDFRRFLNAAHNTDAQIGALYAYLEDLGLADDTLVVITADHGEAFGQHGCFMHGDTLFDEEVRVPLVLINRHLAAAAGTRSGAVGSHVDLWPTITDVCGLPCNPAWQGRSLLGDAADRRAYFSRRGAVGVREGPFKYIWDYESRREYLFDLTADPAERTNLAGERRDYCLRQRRRLRDWTLFQSGLTKAPRGARVILLRPPFDILQQ